MKKKMVALILTALLLGGCAGNLSHSTDLTATVSGAVIKKVDISGESYQPQNPKQKIAGWNLELLRESFSGENILLSPLSLTAALGMAANGADGGTLTELETFLQTDVDTLNQYMKAYLDQLPAGRSSWPTPSGCGAMTACRWRRTFCARRKMATVRRSTSPPSTRAPSRTSTPGSTKRQTA